MRTLRESYVPNNKIFVFYFRYSCDFFSSKFLRNRCLYNFQIKTNVVNFGASVKKPKLKMP